MEAKSENKRKFILRGGESLHAPGLPLDNATVLEFWRWAFSDLRFNDVRGVFAEWLVARLLQIEPAGRDSWAGWDLETREGVKIEVKASAYVQAWQQRSPSKIVFSGLYGKLWDPVSGLYTETSTYNADVYVFCLQTERDWDKWDALDLSQWHFYLALKEQIEQRKAKTISLTALSKIAVPMDAEGFRRKGIEIIHSIAAATVFADNSKHKL